MSSSVSSPPPPPASMYPLAEPMPGTSTSSSPTPSSSAPMYPPAEPMPTATTAAPMYPLAEPVSVTTTPTLAQSTNMTLTSPSSSLATTPSVLHPAIKRSADDVARAEAEEEEENGDPALNGTTVAASAAPTPLAMLAGVLAAAVDSSPAEALMPAAKRAKLEPSSISASLAMAPAPIIVETTSSSAAVSVVVDVPVADVPAISNGFTAPLAEDAPESVENMQPLQHLPHDDPMDVDDPTAAAAAAAANVVTMETTSSTAVPSASPTGPLTPTSLSAMTSSASPAAERSNEPPFHPTMEAFSAFGGDLESAVVPVAAASPPVKHEHVEAAPVAAAVPTVAPVTAQSTIPAAPVLHPVHASADFESDYSATPMTTASTSLASVLDPAPQHHPDVLSAMNATSHSSLASAPLTTPQLPPSGTANATRPMTPAYHKHMTAAIRAIRKLKDAEPFKDPVDPIRLNIPDYPLIVKNPMDLSTISDKLSRRVYATVEELDHDFQLMVDNCIRYNGDQSVYAASARKMRLSFDKQLERLTAVDMAPHLPPTPRPLPGSAFAAGSAHASPHASPSPTISRQAAAAAAAANAAAFAHSHAGSSPSSDLDAALSVVKELFKKTHIKLAGPFLAPVDRSVPSYYETIKSPMDFGTIRSRLEQGGYYADSAQVLADCRQVFTNCSLFNAPGSVVYGMGKQTETVFRHAWERKFGGGGQAQHRHGGNATPAAVVGGPAAALAKAPTPRPKKSRRTTPAPSKLGGSSSRDSGSDDSGSEEGRTARSQIAALRQSIGLLQSQLDQCIAEHRISKRKRRDAYTLPSHSYAAPPAPPVARRGSNAVSSSSGGRSGGGGGGGGRSRASAPARAHPAPKTAAPAPPAMAAAPPPPPPPPVVPAVEVTWDMKREISERMGDLPPEKQVMAAEIIRAAMPNMPTNAANEIELDISVLENSTLYALWQLVATAAPLVMMAAAAPASAAPLGVAELLAADPTQAPGAAAAAPSSLAAALSSGSVAAAIAALPAAIGTSSDLAHVPPSLSPSDPSASLAVAQQHGHHHHYHHAHGNAGHGGRGQKPPVSLSKQLEASDEEEESEGSSESESE
ncbi:hypothetical protein BC828DRAFT_375383 [Blastocladiella britannica]|nr:hypothetical protein BC828DRAFT_375383 [Blastocladiella britannica]